MARRSDGRCAEWRPLRKGIADLHRRAQVCQAANERYLDALAATDTSTSLGALLRQVCRPTTHNRRRIRGLRPWAADELALFQALNRGEFAIHGLRNATSNGSCSPARQAPRSTTATAARTSLISCPSSARTASCTRSPRATATRSARRAARS